MKVWDCKAVSLESCLEYAGLSDCLVLSRLGTVDLLLARYGCLVAKGW